jgi:hypothetical protein
MSLELHGRLQQTIAASGLWNDGAQNRKFLLSPAVYELPAAQANELDRLGKSVKKCFAGLNYMAAEVSNPKLGHDPAWRIIRAALTNGVSKVFTPLQKMNPEEQSMITKIDLMEDVFGNFWIAEIDGYNPRGMGYSTLAARLAKQASTAGRLPGVAASLARQLIERGRDRFTFLYADNERFYLPEFAIFQSEMAEHGIGVEVVSELDLKLDETDGNLFVVFPPLNKNVPLAQQLSRRYQNGSVSFLIPPKPYLGSKAVLALIKNQERNQELEKVLREYVEGAALECVRQYIPETYLVGKNGDKSKRTLHLCGWKQALELDPARYVLKRSVSSGMKGVFFHDDDQYPAALEEAANCQGNFVLQREVEQLDRPFEYFACEHGLVDSASWHTRVTVHIIGDDLADIVVTARQDKRVHGATDCLQLGTILV